MCWCQLKQAQFSRCIKTVEKIRGSYPLPLLGEAVLAIALFCTSKHAAAVKAVKAASTQKSCSTRHKETAPPMAQVAMVQHSQHYNSTTTASITAHDSTHDSSHNIKRHYHDRYHNHSPHLQLCYLLR